MKIYQDAALTVADSLSNQTQSSLRFNRRCCHAGLFFAVKLPQAIIEVGREIRCRNRSRRSDPYDEKHRRNRSDNFPGKIIGHARFIRARPVEYLFIAEKPTLLLAS